MSNAKHLLLTGALFFGVLLLGTALLIVPVRREIQGVRKDAQLLREEVESNIGRAEHVHDLQRQLYEARDRVANEFRNIPTTPRIAHVMQQLSPPVDGTTVRDWSLRQGMPASAVSDSEVAAMAIPLHAEMQAKFESVFQVLRVAESMNDLMRISSVRMNTTGGRGGNARQQDIGDDPVVTAAIALEAIYDPTEPAKVREHQ